MSVASNGNATEWKGYFKYSIEQVKEIEKRLALKDDKSVSNAVSVTSVASDSSNGSSASESSNSNEALDMITTPIVLVTKSEGDNELHSKLEDLQGKTILAVNYGFINYLLPAQQSPKNLRELPAELQKKLFFIADDYDPSNPSLDGLSNLFVPLLHSLNFWIHFVSDDNATPLTENLGTTFAYVVNAIKQQKETGHSASPFGYSLVSGEKRLKDVLPVFELNTDDVNLFILFDMMERGICSVYRYLQYLTMPSGEKKPKTLTEWFQMQEGLEEGVGGKGIPDPQISFFAKTSLLDSERQILEAYAEFLELNKAIQAYNDDEEDEDNEESDLQLFKSKYEDILQGFSYAENDVKDYIATHDENAEPNVYKKEEFTTTKEENAKVFARITEIKDAAERIYKEQADRLGSDKLPEMKVRPIVVGKLDITTLLKPKNITLAWIEKWIASNFKDRMTDSEKVDVRYKVSQGGRFNFEKFNDYDVIQTPGMGNCLISAILTAISSNYRKVPLEYRDAITVQFRSIIGNLQTATGAPLFTEAQKADLCIGGKFLSDDTGFKLAKHLGLNLAYLVGYNEGTTGIFPIADEIKGADWILLYNTGASIQRGDSGLHYDAVRAPDGLFLSKVSELIADFQSKHQKPAVIEDARLEQIMTRLKELHDNILKSIQESSKAGNNEDALKHLTSAETSGTEFDTIADGEFLAAIEGTKDKDSYNGWRKTIDEALKKAKEDFATKWGAPVAAVAVVPVGAAEAGVKKAEEEAAAAAKKAANNAEAAGKREEAEAAMKKAEADAAAAAAKKEVNDAEAARKRNAAKKEADAAHEEYIRQITDIQQQITKIVAHGTRLQTNNDGAISSELTSAIRLRNEYIIIRDNRKVSTSTNMDEFTRFNQTTAPIEQSINREIRKLEQHIDNIKAKNVKTKRNANIARAEAAEAARAAEEAKRKADADAAEEAKKANAAAAQNKALRAAACDIPLKDLQKEDYKTFFTKFKIPDDGWCLYISALISNEKDISSLTLREMYAKIPGLLDQISIMKFDNFHYIPKISNTNVNDLNTQFRDGVRIRVDNTETYKQYLKTAREKVDAQDFILTPTTTVVCEKFKDEYKLFFQNNDGKRAPIFEGPLLWPSPSIIGPALATFFNEPLFIVQDANTIVFPLNGSNEGKKGVYIFYNGENHYDALRLKGDEMPPEFLTKLQQELAARAAPVGGGAAGALPGKTENNYIDDIVGDLEFLDGRIRYIQSLNSVSKKNATNVKGNLGEFDSKQISRTIYRIRRNLQRVKDPRKSELSAELEKRIQTLAELKKTIEAHLATLKVPTAPPTAVVPPPMPAPAPTPVPPTPAVLPTPVSSSEISIGRKYLGNLRNTKKRSESAFVQTRRKNITGNRTKKLINYATPEEVRKIALLRLSNSGELSKEEKRLIRNSRSAKGRPVPNSTPIDFGFLNLNEIDALQKGRNSKKSELDSIKLRKTTVEPKPAGASASSVGAPVPNLHKTNSASQIKSEMARLEKELSVVEALPAKFGEAAYQKTLKIQELKQKLRELQLKQGRTTRRNRRTARKTRRNK